MKQKIVLALGGNALGNTLPEQLKAAQVTAKAIVDLVEDGHQVVIVHGNGPQVGVINNAMTEYTQNNNSFTVPLSVCVREDTDPTLTFTLHVTSHSHTSCLNLTGCNPMCIQRLDTKGAKCQLIAAHCVALATVLLRPSIFSSFWL